MADLEVLFIDELYTARPGDTLTFGREGDIVVDEANRFMHRQIGRFVDHHDLWWLVNDGRRVELTAWLGAGKTVVLPPGESVALTATGLVRFDAGALSYELEYRLPDELELPGPPAEPERFEVGPDGVRTAEFGVIPLNAEQRLLLVALCEPRLRDPLAGRTSLPTNAEVAARLGWSTKKFDRKLDYLCAKLDEAGVRGVRGGRGVEATTRRANVAEHAVRNGLVERDDLRLLDALPPH